MLIVGRIVHAIGVSQERERLALRVTGMALTLAAILSAAAFNLTGPVILAAIDIR